MSAERGWIGEPQPVKMWHRSRASCEADKIAQRAETQRLCDLAAISRTGR